MTKYLLLLVSSGVFAIGIAFAQAPDINNYLSMIENGQSDPVRLELPSLLQKYPNDPGILYLQAVLTTDGTEAVRLYQKIVDSYPKSEWADDALYRVYKFYYAIGLFRTAEIKLDQLRKDYPDSKYIAEVGPAETPPAASGGVAEQQPPAQNSAPSEQKVAETPVAVPPVTSGAGTNEQKKAPVEAAPAVTTPEPSAGKYTLQFGAFSTRGNANKQKSFFTYHNYPVEVSKESRGDRELYMVYVGTYKTADEARAAGDRIKSSFNLNYIVVMR